MGNVKNYLPHLLAILLVFAFLAGCVQQQEKSSSGNDEEMRTSALRSINNAIIRINAAEKDGKDTRDARNRLQDANAAFANGEYELALRLAEKAGILIKDGGQSDREEKNTQPSGLNTSIQPGTSVRPDAELPVPSDYPPSPPLSAIVPSSPSTGGQISAPQPSSQSPATGAADSDDLPPMPIDE